MNLLERIEKFKIKLLDGLEHTPDYNHKIERLCAGSDGTDLIEIKTYDPVTNWKVDALEEVYYMI